MTDVESRLIQKLGKQKAIAALEAVGKDMDFIKAIQTSLGKELLSGWMDDWLMLLGKIATNTATEEDRVGFLIIDKYLTGAAKRIAHYYQITGGH